MKVILTMAISANGMIASNTGNEDFLSHINWLQFIRLATKIGCFIWGRKTYDAVIKWEGNYLHDIEHMKKVIISQSDIKLKEGFVLAQSPEEALLLLEKDGFSEVIITGGSTINSEFAKRGLINEVILDINPSIVGDGIPVFKQAQFFLSLELTDVEKLNDGIVEVRYTVKK